MKTILLKLSGELLAQDKADTSLLHPELINDLMKQIKELHKTYHFGVVVGGGNFFRGSKEGKVLSITRQTADQVGMLATVMNGLILHDYFVKHEIPVVLTTARHMPHVGTALNQHVIEQAKATHQCIIFAGGTGDPFLTTDTTAIMRSLQMGADEVWKATKVDYIYNENPTLHPDAKPLIRISYQQALEQRLEFMDLTATALAATYGITVRVFNFATPHALLKVAQNPEFGSTVTK